MREFYIEDHKSDVLVCMDGGQVMQRYQAKDYDGSPGNSPLELAKVYGRGLVSRGWTFRPVKGCAEL